MDLLMGYVLAVDPGIHIGVALFTEEGVCLWRVVMDFEELTDWCQAEQSIARIVYEGFINGYRTPKLKGSKNEASQVIGMLRALARQRRIPITASRPDDLRVAALHAGIKIPKGHVRDELSAYLHGFEWFIRQGATAAEMRRKQTLL
jgi:hypothetical protein